MRIKLRATIVGESCIYCGNPAQEYEHVIPKSLDPFFDAGWNIKPACKPCNRSKSNTISIRHIQTPGNDFTEDAAIWGAVYNSLDGSTEDKDALIEAARKDLGKWNIFGRTAAFGCLEVYIGKHLCVFWEECQDRCATNGQLVDLVGNGQVWVDAPEGLQNLVHTFAIS